MQVDMNRILRRAADFQKLVDPEDRLSDMTRRPAEESELAEHELDQISAAAEYKLFVQKSKKDRNKRKF